MAFYCVETEPSFSTSRCSLDESVCTLSSGKEALLRTSSVSAAFCPKAYTLWWSLIYLMGRGGDAREALDQLELVDDLAALVGDLLLCAVSIEGQ